MAIGAGTAYFMPVSVAGVIPMPRELAKTLTYLSIHLAVGFSVAYAFTGSLALAGGIALIEPCINAVAFFFHERAWKRIDAAGLWRVGTADVLAKARRVVMPAMMPTASSGARWRQAGCGAAG